MMVTYNSKVDMARSAGREYRFSSLVRNQIGHGFAVGLIVGIILASYLVVSYGHSSASDCLPGGRGCLEADFQPGVYSVCSYPTLGRSGSGSVDYRLPVAAHEPDGGNSLAFGDQIGRRGMGFKFAGGQSCRAPTVACDSQRYLGSIGRW